MSTFLTDLAARFREPSTYASIAAVMAVFGVAVPDGVLHSAMTGGVVLAGGLGVFLGERGTKPALDVAGDVARSVIAGIQAAPKVVPVLAMLALGSLAACTSLPQTSAAVTAAMTKAKADAQLTIRLYGIAKGVAEVAMLSDPTLVPVVTPAVAKLDPLVAKAQAALDFATLDAAALESLVASINDQVMQLTVKTAPAVTVVPAI